MCLLGSRESGATIFSTQIFVAEESDRFIICQWDWLTSVQAISNDCRQLLNV